MICITSLVIMTACGGGNKNNNAADGKEITDFSDSEGNGLSKASTFFGYGGDREPFKLSKRDT